MTDLVDLLVGRTPAFDAFGLRRSDALFACGESEFQADRYSLAIGHYERLIDEFPRASG